MTNSISRLRCAARSSGRGSSERGQLISSPRGANRRGFTMNDRAEEERDEYDQLLVTIGRSADDDLRISVHEAAHAICARLLGHPVDGVTINPGSGYEGLCWGASHKEAFADGRGDASSVRETLAPMMPGLGEDRSVVSDIFVNVYDKCIELMAGRAAERMLLDGEPVVPTDDLRQARELAMLFCSSEEAIEAFIGHCDIAARDLLLPHGDTVMALSIALRIKRTLDGAEIDKTIRIALAHRDIAIERARRVQWQRTVENAAAFEGQFCR
ncbi:hypothetical protein ACWKUA_11360 [Bradyrhizobium sp. LeoA1S1]